MKEEEKKVQIKKELIKQFSKGQSIMSIYDQQLMMSLCYLSTLITLGRSPSLSSRSKSSIELVQLSSNPSDWR